MRADPPALERIAEQAYATDVIQLDIIEYSLQPNEKQFLSIYYLNRIIRTISRMLELHSFLENERIVQGFLPTGDGCYMVLNPHIAGYGPLFALSLRNFLLFNNPRLDHLFNGVRTGVHHGPVIPVQFLDMPNFVGDGLNVTSRLLTRRVGRKARNFYADAGENVVVVSRPAWDAFKHMFPLRRRAVRDYLQRIRFRYSREYTMPDKHPTQADHRIRFIDSAMLIGSAPPRPDALRTRGDPA